MNRTKKTQTNEKTKRKKNGIQRVFTFPVLACLYLVGHFWIPNVHYSVIVEFRDLRRTVSNIRHNSSSIAPPPNV